MPRTDYILIHRMPKVAAFSIYHSLRASIPDCNIGQLHFLTPGRVAAARGQLQAPDVPPDVASSLRKQIDEAVRCHAEIDNRRRSGQPYCVITGYRDPLDQVVSHCFQGLASFFPEIDVQSDEVPAQAAFMQDKLVRMFQRLITAGQAPTTPDEGHFRRMFTADCVDWFDDEFKEYHGIDLYDYAPDELGLIVIDRGSVRYVVYKQETLRDHFETVLRLVPGVEKVTQINDNEAANKDYAALYRAFRQSFRPPQEMLDFYYASRFFRHFFPNDRPRFAQSAAARPSDGPSLAASQLLKSAVANLHASRESAGTLQRELDEARKELDNTRQQIASMRATKVWRLRSLVRKVLHRPCET